MGRVTGRIGSASVGLRGVVGEGSETRSKVEPFGVYVLKVHPNVAM